jgi:hypothetical protein
MEHTSNRSDSIAEERPILLGDDSIYIQFLFIHNQLEVRGCVDSIEERLNGSVFDFSAVYAEHLRCDHIAILFAQCKAAQRAD